MKIGYIRVSTKDQNTGRQIEALRLRGATSAIGSENLYVRNKDLVERVIDIDDAISVFRENAWKIGKGGDFEYIEFDGNGLVWTQDGPTMCAIWHLAKYTSHGTRNI